MNMPTPDEESEKQDFKKENEEESFFEQETIFESDEEVKEGLTEINFDLVDQGRWLLKVVAGTNQGAEFAMQPETSYVIGTDPSSCDIILHDASISRQHARLTITPDETLVIEDLNSRNGTFVDGHRTVKEEELIPNTLVTLGTTTFIVLDRKAERETIISPLLPSIVRTLQREEERKEEEKKEEEKSIRSEEAAAPKEPSQEGLEIVKEEKTPLTEKKPGPSRAVIAIVAAGLCLFGFATFTLFKSTEVISPIINYNQQIDQALIDFPAIKYSFNPTTGKLLLVGHVLYPNERNQIMNALNELKYVKSIDNNIIIDEYVWREINQVLSKNPAWRGISMSSPAAGAFVLNGYLKTRKEAEQLSEYLSQNFPYTDLLELQVTVEEEVLSEVRLALQELGLRGVTVDVVNGELIFSGAVGSDKKEAYYTFLNELKDYPGIHSIKDGVVELPPEEAVINLSSRYPVTGYSLMDNEKINVIIGGRILGKGDILDGMTITEIRPGVIFLEKGKMKYRIDYNK